MGMKKKKGDLDFGKNERNRKDMRTFKATAVGKRRNEGVVLSISLVPGEHVERGAAAAVGRQKKGRRGRWEKRKEEGSLLLKNC